MKAETITHREAPPMLHMRRRVLSTLSKLGRSKSRSPIICGRAVMVRPDPCRALASDSIPFESAQRGRFAIDQRGYCLYPPKGRPFDNLVLAPEIEATLKTKLLFAYDSEGDGYIITLPGGTDRDPLWLVRNELGGYTAMFASDY